MTHPIHHIPFTFPPPKLQHTWEKGNWQNQSYLEINQFRSESSDHHPLTRVKLGYNEDGIFGIFSVKDRYVICRHTHFQEPVYKDSCVEFFLQPRPQKGYFNFEFNCGGTLLSSYITDPTRTPKGFRGVKYLSFEHGRQIKNHTSLSTFINHEIPDPIDWELAFFIPFKLLTYYVGRFNTDPGAKFRANFFKCADDSSHPHWAAWSPVDQLNFHRPHCFGTLKLT